MARIFIVLISFMLIGCSSIHNNNYRNNVLENMNRMSHKINFSLDEKILEPTAKIYVYLVPQLARNCVHNFFGNVEDLQSAFNSFLQGNGVDSINTIGRFLFNSTMGLCGCFDVASLSGAHKIHNDFGITLGKWGVPSGPYIVLPLIGPSNLRDALGLGINYFLNPTKTYTKEYNSYLSFISIIDYRANMLGLTELIKEVSIDHYSLVKNAYSRKRDLMVNNCEVDFDFDEYNDQQDNI